MENHSHTPGPDVGDDLHRRALALSQAVEQLAGELGVPFEASIAANAVHKAIHESAGTMSAPAATIDAARPLECLAHASASCGIRASPARMPLADAVWQARHGSPFVAVTPGGQWVLFAGRGLFNARLWRSDSHGRWETMARSALASLLGLPDANGVADLLVAHPHRPMAAMEQQGVHEDGHGHGHPAHPKPHQRLLQLMQAELPDIGSIVLFSFITGVLYLAVPLTVDAAVNNIAFGGQQPLFIQSLVVLSVALLVFLGLMAFVRGVQHYLAEVIQRRVFVRIMADLA